MTDDIFTEAVNNLDNDELVNKALSQPLKIRDLSLYMNFVKMLSDPNQDKAKILKMIGANTNPDGSFKPIQQEVIDKVNKSVLIQLNNTLSDIRKIYGVGEKPVFEPVKNLLINYRKLFGQGLCNTIVKNFIYKCLITIENRTFNNNSSLIDVLDMENLDEIVKDCGKKDPSLICNTILPFVLGRFIEYRLKNPTHQDLYNNIEKFINHISNWKQHFDCINKIGPIDFNDKNLKIYFNPLRNLMEKLGDLDMDLYIYYLMNSEFTPVEQFKKLSGYYEAKLIVSKTRVDMCIEDNDNLKEKLREERDKNKDLREKINRLIKR